MNPLYIGLGAVAVVLILLTLYLAFQKPVRAAVKQAVTPTGPVLAPSHEQLLARLVTPAFEDAVDKKRSKRLYDAMLGSYIEQRHPGEAEPAEAPAPAAAKPAAKPAA